MRLYEKQWCKMSLSVGPVSGCLNLAFGEQLDLLVCVSLFVFMYVCILLLVSSWICLYVCVCIYICM